MGTESEGFAPEPGPELDLGIPARAEADEPEVHVDWIMTRAEWDELRSAIKHSDADYCMALDAAGKLDAEPAEFRCPRCDSPDPRQHPAMQADGGEVQLCPHPWHSLASLLPVPEPEAGPSPDRVAGMAGLGAGGDDGVTTPWDTPAQPTARDIEEGILRQEVDCWRAEAARLRCTLAGIDFLVCPALDGGGEWPRESEGLTADVWLLVGRLKAAESEVMRLKGVTVLPGMPGAEL